MAGTLDVAVDGDAPSNVVVVHDVIHNEADLWAWSQDLLGREVERLRHRARTRPATRR